MESMNDVMKRVQAQELIQIFRSKEDLHRYLVQLVKEIVVSKLNYVVGLFLPTMEGTKISFLRAILCEEKKALKTQDVKFAEIPNYPEISVTNLYDDAMNDPEVSQYLPTKKQLSNKLPERNYFFGILATIKGDYLKEIIQESHKKRYSISPEDKSKQGIKISESWLSELQKHPYISSKICSLTLQKNLVLASS
uniref:22 kD ORF n=1 Tax=Oxytricha fallax TaxID=5944 RepID=P90560_OXYFA|nr:22 kD ORF [Oxytricha fallax]